MSIALFTRSSTVTSNLLRFKDCLRQSNSICMTTISVDYIAETICPQMNVLMLASI